MPVKAMQEYLFKPLAMFDTNFNMVSPIPGDRAAPHGIGKDGDVVLAPMALNYSSQAFRPAGGAWTSVHDLALFLQFEARAGKLEDGKQWISEVNVLARRQPQIVTGLDSAYGMGLGINQKLGIQSLNHSGSLFGYNSTIYLIPESGIGLVAMSNAEQGMGLLNLAVRRLLELTYEAKPQALASLSQLREQVDNDSREKRASVLNGDHQLYRLLAKRYSNPMLGSLTIRSQGQYRIFDFGDWQTRVIGHKDASGKITFSGIDATTDFVDFQFLKTAKSSSIVVEIGQERYQFDAESNENKR